MPSQAELLESALKTIRANYEVGESTGNDYLTDTYVEVCSMLNFDAESNEECLDLIAVYDDGRVSVAGVNGRQYFALHEYPSLQAMLDAMTYAVWAVRRDWANQGDLMAQTRKEFLRLLRAGEACKFDLVSECYTLLITICGLHPDCDEPTCDRIGVTELGMIEIDGGRRPEHRVDLLQMTTAEAIEAVLLGLSKKYEKTCSAPAALDELVKRLGFDDCDHSADHVSVRKGNEIWIAGDYTREDTERYADIDGAEYHAFHSFDDWLDALVESK